MQHGSVILQLLATAFLVFVTASSLHAQFHESFESPVPSWDRRETDCIIPDSQWRQKRSNDLETRNRFEEISFQTSAGTKILVSHNISPALVISELRPSLRIKSSRPGIQIFVRVVLPHTPSPEGRGPMTTLLPGPTCRHAEDWKTISFASESKNLQEKLKEELWLLRRKHGPHITDRDAYIDKIVLNLYTGAGDSLVQVDDLKVDGVVAADKLAAKVALENGDIHRDPSVQVAGSTEPAERHKSLVIRDGTVLLVKKKPFFPLIIQHQGEPFEFLKSLGFNVVELKATATYEQLKQAEDLGLWLVCPAPTSIGLSPIEFQYDRVLAWSMGQQLTGRNVTTIQERIREIRESDLREGRPVVAGAASHWTTIAQQVDILNVGLEPIGSSFLASQYSDWILQRSQSIYNTKPVWADIQTDFPKSLSSQISTIAQQVPPTPIEPQQLKVLAYEAITGGARGLRFTSRSRLDNSDPTTRLRALSIEWINSEILRLEPWIVGGALMGQVPTDDTEIQVTAISTNRSRLLLIQRPTHHEQYVAGDSPVRTISFRDSDTTFTDRAFLIADTGLENLPNSRSLGGNEIRIENCPYAAAVVLTQDPMVTTNLNQSYRRQGRPTSFEIRIQLTRQWLAIMQLIDRQLSEMGRSSTAASAALNEAVNAFRTASSLVENNSPQTAVTHVDRTDERLAFARREMITEPLGMFQSKTSSPLISHCSLIPLHWELADRLVNSQWQPNGLPGGDFEDLNHMMQSGWENRRLDDNQVDTKVELLEGEAALDGRYGLRMEVRPAHDSSVVDAIPLWITTPRVPVRGGQLIRIHGWVNIPQVIQGNADGLKIIDSIGGDEMAERIPITQGWQEFTLYRGVESDRDVQVKFALTGIGEVFIDEVTIRAVDLPSRARQARVDQ